MKKLLFILLCIIAVSCTGERREEAIIYTSTTKTYIDINGHKYYKIKVGNHDMYQYEFITYLETGSDVFHLEDLCEYCSKNNK